MHFQFIVTAFQALELKFEYRVEHPVSHKRTKEQGSRKRKRARPPAKPNERMHTKCPEARMLQAGRRASDVPIPSHLVTINVC